MMLKSLMAALLLAAGSVVAQESAPAQAAAESSEGTAATNSVKTVEKDVPEKYEFVRTAKLRNPYWEIGFEGEREAISDGSAEAENAELVAQLEEEQFERNAMRRARSGNDDDAATQAQRWAEAYRMVKVSGVTKAFVGRDERQVIVINGRTYFIGDYLTVDTSTHRFYWQVAEFDDVGGVKLARVKYIKLGGK